NGCSRQTRLAPKWQAPIPPLPKSHNHCDEVLEELVQPFMSPVRSLGIEQLERYAIYGRPETVNFLPLRSFDKLVVGLAADPNRLIPERESSQARLILCRRDFSAAHVPPSPRWKDAFLSYK
ncbi:hypothetical protein, partial [Bradyrhizobium sp. WSM2254]|uniref:hypothetical protein n=1 Tax=Bradyrhizobium sp. WSM2254 TaxID=1188263 RepID=UPI001AEC4CCC